MNQDAFEIFMAAASLFFVASNMNRTRYVAAVIWALSAAIWLSLR